MKRIAVLLLLALLGLGMSGCGGAEDPTEPVKVPESPGRVPPDPSGG